MTLKKIIIVLFLSFFSESAFSQHYSTDYQDFYEDYWFQEGNFPPLLQKVALNWILSLKSGADYINQIINSTDIILSTETAFTIEREERLRKEAVDWIQKSYYDITNEVNNEETQFLAQLYSEQLIGTWEIQQVFDKYGNELTDEVDECTLYEVSRFSRDENNKNVLDRLSCNSNEESSWELNKITPWELNGITLSTEENGNTVYQNIGFLSPTTLCVIFPGGAFMILEKNDNFWSDEFLYHPYWDWDVYWGNFPDFDENWIDPSWDKYEEEYPEEQSE